MERKCQEHFEGIFKFSIKMDSFKLYNGAWVEKSHPHKTVKITTEDAAQLLYGGGYFVRNVFNFDHTANRLFWYVIKDSFGGIGELPTKVRNQVRKSLKTYEFKRATFEQMSAIGPELFNKSRERFGGVKITQDSWNRRISGENADLWLGIDRQSGKPASFSINTLFDDYCNYNTMGISPDFSNSTYPMYGLLYEMNKFYLQEHGLRYVMDGARSITEHSNIQPFLEDKFKFRKAYCDLQLFYKPWLGMVVNFLFPFRRYVRQRKVAAMLRQEAWARGIER